MFPCLSIKKDQPTYSGIYIKLPSRIYIADVYLNTLVKNPVKIVYGRSAILKVEKSVAGTLSWTHGGKLVRGVDRHYTFVDSSKTELEISDASPEQAGNYEVLLQVGGCKIRKIIEVEIGLYFLVSDSCDRLPNSTCYCKLVTHTVCFSFLYLIGA